MYSNIESIKSQCLMVYEHLFEGAIYVPFLNNELAMAWHNAKFTDEGSFANDSIYTKSPTKKKQLLKELKQSLSPEDYSKVLELISNVCAIEDIAKHHYFQEGWFARENKIGMDIQERLLH